MVWHQSYEKFQSNCKNCGGPITPVVEAGPVQAEVALQTPPPPPRSISNGYIWRLLLSDGTAIASGIILFLGTIFTVLGGVLTITIITAFVGIPFLLFGLAFLVGGGVVFYKRYQAFEKIMRVLREGVAAVGEIVSVEENYNVQINHRNPWKIAYRFEVNGQEYTGKVSTLNPPEAALQPEKPVSVLYLVSEPEINSLYPHP